MTSSTFACPFCRIALSPSESVCPRDGHHAQPVEWLTIPASLSKRFRVLNPFAHGSTGSLYVADESESGRRGLLKILSSVPKHREPERARLRRELGKQTTLANARLVVPSASGETDGVTWLFRPFLEGMSLRVRLAQTGTLALDEALSISAQITIALDELHRGGLLHRDVKPSHVFLQTNAAQGLEALLIDPGLCGALVRPGNSTVLGTPGYVAPEQLQGKLVSFRSDLYSLGCVMYEMLVGRPPFTGESEQAVLAAQLSGEPPELPPGLPEAIVAVLRSLLSREPQERPFSAQKLRRVFEPYAPDGTPMTRPPPTSTSGSSTDADKPAAKPAVTPSLPPPPPSEALRTSRAPAAEPAQPKLHSAPPPPAVPRAAVPSRMPGRPTTRGLAPPPPPRPIPADATQQIDLEQFEVVMEDAADRTQELSPEHLVEVARGPEPATRPTASKAAARERDDHTVPVRLDQVLAIAPARLRASAAPPLPSEATPQPAPAPVLTPAPEPASVAAPVSTSIAAPVSAGTPVTPAVTGHQTMFVEDEHETLPFPGDDGAHGLPAPSGLFGALPPQPEPSNAFAAALTRDDDDDDEDAQQTTVAPRPLAPAPYPDSIPSFAGDDDPTTALPAASGLSPTTLDDNNDEAAAASRHLQDTLHPYMLGSGLRRNKLAWTGGAAALLVLGVLTVKALSGGSDANVASRDTAGTLAVPPPPVPTVEPTPSVTALAASPKHGAKPSAQPVPAAALPSAEPQAAAAQVEPQAPPPAPLVEAQAPAAAPTVEKAEAKPSASHDDKRQRRDDRARVLAEKAARERAEKEARAQAEKAAREAKAAKQSKGKKGSAAADRTAKWSEAVEEARGHYAAKRYKQAAQAYERATQFDPTSDRTFSGLGTARFKAGDFKGAAAAYQRAVQLAPSNSVYHTSLARTYQQMGDNSKAKASYKRAVALDPKNEGAKKSLKDLGG